MKFYIRIFVALFVVFSLLQNADAFEIKNPFKKKQESPKQKMVETKEEWEIQSLNVPLEERKLEEYKAPVSIKKYHVPEINFVFEKYNYPQGTRTLDIQDIKKKLYSYPYVVADLNCRYIAYPQYYFSPEINQISSNFFVEKLDTSKTKTKRILDYNHKQKERIPIIQAGTKKHYPNLFNGLTLVDWSHDGTKLLIKEQVGSLLNGIYKTYLYVHFMENDIESGYTIKLTNFDNAIKHYFLDWENLQIVKYRYDIEPLGFSAENDNIIIALCYVYDKNGKKIFMGKWGYNCATNEVLLLSKTETNSNISVNGLILKQKLE